MNARCSAAAAGSVTRAAATKSETNETNIRLAARIRFSFVRNRPAGSRIPYSRKVLALFAVWFWHPLKRKTKISRHREEFEQAIRAYSADLYRFAYWLCRDRHAAEDAVQEACMRAWTSWAGLRDPGGARAWLMTIVRNEVARRFSRGKGDACLDEVEEAQLPSIPSFEAGIETAQMVAQLPATYREPLLLQVLGGFSCAEIAATLGTTEGAVMTRLTRARAALRRQHAEPLKLGTAR